MEIYAVKFNGLSAPLGMCSDEVILSWKIRSAEGKAQRSACIEVSTCEDFSHILICVTDADSLGTMLPYNWLPRTRYYVRLSIESDAGEKAQAVHFFETGKKNEAWAGQWIGPKDDSFSPEFLRQLPINGEITSARLYLCGLGLFEAYLGESKIGEDHLAPFLNDYEAGAQACTYDITDQLKASQELRILLGRGWWMGRFGLTNHAFHDKHYALIAEVHIRYSDGREEVIGTDETWQYRPSPFVFTDIYDGETQDWTAWQNHLNDLYPARLISAPVPIQDRYSLPLRVMEAFPVKEVIHSSKGEVILDFGQNMAGIVSCSQHIPAGDTLTMEFGEVLQDGCFYPDNYRTAKSVFS